MSDQPDWLAYDRAHVWHPYSTLADPPPAQAVVAAHGSRIVLADGRELVDGMASWWAAIHGYNHPHLNAAVTAQLGRMAHVMFGGLAHEGAATLARRLTERAPAGLVHTFFADSGSVAMEVALKMALQYRVARGEAGRHRFLTLRGGYHGDTFGAMSVCDPVNGMHGLFSTVLPRQLFAPRPVCRHDEVWDETDVDALRQLARAHRDELTAIVLEPIVQGAGGMWFYHPHYLAAVRALCDELGLLLIADEIATGFGRTGRFFACEHAGVAPDILCVGKALTGGYMTLAATLVNAAVADTICRGEPGVFMHGPTFMANPLACACANASLDLLADDTWQGEVARIGRALATGLAPARELPGVTDVRVLGAIGVIERREPVDLRAATNLAVARGVWLRPFGRLVYAMPPYVLTDAEVAQVAAAMCELAAL